VVARIDGKVGVEIGGTFKECMGAGREDWVVGVLSAAEVRRLVFFGHGLRVENRRD